MGFKFNKTYQVDSAQDGGDRVPMLNTVVTGSSITDTLCIEQDGSSVVFDVATFAELVADLRRAGVLRG